MDSVPAWLVDEETGLVNSLSVSGHEPLKMSLQGLLDKSIVGKRIGYIAVEEVRGGGKLGCWYVGEMCVCG